MAKNIEELINFNNKYLNKNPPTISQNNNNQLNKEQKSISSEYIALNKIQDDKSVYLEKISKEEQKLNINNISHEKNEKLILSVNNVYNKKVEDISITPIALEKTDAAIKNIISTPIEKDEKVLNKASLSSAVFKAFQTVRRDINFISVTPKYYTKDQIKKPIYIENKEEKRTENTITTNVTLATKEKLEKETNYGIEVTKQKIEPNVVYDTNVKRQDVKKDFDPKNTIVKEQIDKTVNPVINKKSTGTPQGVLNEENNISVAATKILDIDSELGIDRTTPAQEDSIKIPETKQLEKDKTDKTITTSLETKKFTTVPFDEKKDLKQELDVSVEQDILTKADVTVYPSNEGVFDKKEEIDKTAEQEVLTKSTLVTYPSNEGVFDKKQGNPLVVNPLKEEDEILKIGTESINLKNSKLKLSNSIDPELQKKINDILGNINESLKTTRPGEIGFLYVKPITTSANYLPFKIPFEFNPKISESGLQARYNAVSFLSRIGDIQNFTGVSPLTISLSAEYKVLSDGSNTSDDPDYWLNFYTQENIDKIEMAYRSLILPDFILSNSQATYIRPPAVKIIFGDEKKLNLLNTSDNLDYSKGQFEFSYPAYPANVSNLYSSNKILESQKTNPLRFHKLFVVTNVTINKDITQEVIYTKNGINRFTGFTVDITLVEVSENYMDLFPDYKVYYEFFKNSTMPRRG